MTDSNHLGLRLEDLAEGLFVDLGFHLPGEHRFTGSPYGDHYSVFRAESGLCVRAGFSPLDGHYAEPKFGHEWVRREEHLRVSGAYSTFGRELGIDLPDSYEIVLDEEGIPSCVSAMHRDLARSLPEIMNNVTLQVLEHAEAGRFGALTSARNIWGDDYLNFVEVKDCQL